MCVERPWVRAREVCRALKYNKETANIVKNYCSKENYAQKYQISSVPGTVTHVVWPKDSQRFDININEEATYKLLFSSQQPKAKDFRRHCCNVLQSLEFINEKYEQKILRLNEYIDDLITTGT